MLPKGYDAELHPPPTPTHRLTRNAPPQLIRTQPEKENTFKHIDEFGLKNTSVGVRILKFCLLPIRKGDLFHNNIFITLAFQQTLKKTSELLV
jgi:hypothetical protein